MKSVIAVHKTFSLNWIFLSGFCTAESELMMPKRGIWQHTRKMKSVIAVHKTFSLNWIFLSGFCISGSIEQKGLTNSRNLIPNLRPTTQQVVPDYLSCRSESSNKSL